MTAFHVLTSVAIVVLFLGLGAVLREVRLLRSMVAGNTDGFTAGQPDIVLGGWFAPDNTGAAGAAGHAAARRIVLAADSGCPLCLIVAERLAQRLPGATLLTHEPAQTWAAVSNRLNIVHDREAWRSVAHLSPPVLMLVDGAGRVLALNLPVRADEVDRLLTDWSQGLVEKEISRAADVHAHS